MLGLVPAVRSYFWIFNRYPIIPKGLLNKTKKKPNQLIEMQLMAQDAPAANGCTYRGLFPLPAWQSLEGWAFSMLVGANVLY